MSLDDRSGWSPPTVEELRNLLPQLEIESLIGRGGMGAVYLGWQTALERRVAIKILPESLARDDSESKATQRFKLEAKGLAGLDHPGIVSIYDFGETAKGHLYFVMEYVDGTDVKKLLAERGGSLEIEEAALITEHVLDALDYAHSRGIIHRDIKPENVLISLEGRVKIADFGLIKKLSGDEADEPLEDRLTLTNIAVGTPDYIAPEVFTGESLPDHRADLYAVGVMLYRMLTGKLPRGMFTLPSVSKVELKTDHDELVSRALESDPALRFQSAVEFKESLGKICPVENSVSVDVPKKSRSKFAGALVVGAIFLIALLVAIFVGPHFSAPPNTSQKSGIDLTSVDTWRKEGDASWVLQSGTIRAGSREGGLLKIELPFEEFDLTGEVLTEPSANGGIGFWGTEIGPSGKPKGGYLFHLSGRRGSGVNAGSLMMDSVISESKTSMLTDGKWTSFRLRVTRTSLRGFLDETQTFLFPPLPENRRARGRLLYLLHERSDDKISYRSLRVSPLNE